MKILNNKTLCEKIRGTLKKDEKNTVYYTVLTLDETGCKGIKWWAIVLILIGVLAAIIVIFFIVVFNNKSLRKKLLPFNREIRNNIEDDEIYGDEQINRSRMYTGKGKRNPLYTL